MLQKYMYICFEAFLLNKNIKKIRIGLMQINKDLNRIIDKYILYEQKLFNYKKKSNSLEYMNIYLKKWRIIYE